MMTWQPGEGDVRAAWANFSGEWDFEKSGDLRLPLGRLMTSSEAAAEINTAPTQQRLWHAVISLEHGRLNGEPAKRIVARVPSTDVEVILETYAR